MLEYETVPFGSYERLNIVNRQIHFKAQGMWGTCRVLPGYILSIYPAHDNMNISQKLPLSSTRGKLSRLLKVTLCGATGCQRQQCLIQFFRYFSNKQKIAIFLLWLSDQKHGRGTEIALTCLFLWHLNEKCHFWLDQPPGLFRAQYNLQKYQQTCLAILFHL